MSNEFITIFNPLLEEERIRRSVTDKIDCVKVGLKQDEPFSDLGEDIQQALPAYAAWVAEKMQKVTPTQLRRFYTHVKALSRNAQDDDTGQLDIRSRVGLKFLLPKLAGSIKKKEEGLRVLYEVFAICIQMHNKIRTKQDMESFVEFFEAILDYHETLQQ